MALASAVTFAGCALPRAGVGGGACTASVECDDGNPCTEDSCDTVGLCQHEALPDGINEAQIPGDCQVSSCDGGVFSSSFDTSDVLDDGDPCTADVCDAANGAQNIVLADGAPCEDSGGHPGTCMAGICEVECTVGGPADQCDDPEVCTVDSCDAATGLCVHEPLNGTVVPEDLPVYCQVTLCQDGVATPVNDNTDLEIDTNQCTGDECNEGSAEHPALPAGTLCDQNDGRVCNGDELNPQCVECLDPSHCEEIAPSNECRSWQCMANTCIEQLTPNGTPLQMGQEQGNCQTLVCDGNGNAVQQVEPTDVPIDGFECTEDLCNGMTPANPALPINTPCGLNGTLFCDGNGLCTDCTQNDQCGDDTDCQLHICDANNVCQVNNIAAGTPLPPSEQIANDCNVIECDGNGGTQMTPDDTDLPISDGIQCTADTCNNGMVEYDPQSLNFPCNQMGVVCDGMGTCVGCNDPTHCGTPLDCQFYTCVANACVTNNEPSTTAAPVTYQTDGDCQVFMCDGVGAVSAMSAAQDTDLPLDNNECTSDLCTMGVPSNPPVASGVTCTQNGGTVCNGDMANPMCVECVNAMQCPAGDVCLPSWMCCTPDTCGTLSQTCGMPSDNCGGTLMCGGMQDGSETDVDCGGNPANCADRCAQGQMCTQNSDCAGGLCADGVCCDTACSGSCESCNQMGNVGTCMLLGAGSAGNPACPNGFLCDGTTGNCPTVCTADTDCASTHYCDMGNCVLKKPLGDPCAMGNECQSAICADNVCCDTACTETCAACNIAGSEGTCTAHAAGTDPEAECSEDIPNCVQADCNGMMGATACQAGDGIECIAASCNAGVETTQGTCTSGACGGSVMNNCDPFICGTDACLNSCTTSGDCIAGYFCNTSNSTCELQVPQGSACNGTIGNDECVTGFCADNICCDSDCTETCAACNIMGSIGICSAQPAGTDPDNDCTLDVLNCVATDCNGTTGPNACDATNGTQCIAPSCNAGVETTQGVCTAGSCGGSMMNNCDPYICGANACLNTCASSGDCTNGNFCNTVTSLCEPQLAQGVACAGNVGADECASGNCVDGFCCNTPCTDTCGSCGLSGTEGVCTGYAAGTDPENECTFDMLNCVAADCNGALGASACDATNGTECVAASCNAGMETTQGTCTSGTCGGSTTNNCDPYICGVNACLGMCTTSTDCTAGNFCNTMTSLCEPQVAQGGVCDGTIGADECTTGFCADNICCDTACTETCAACNVSGSEGMCSAQPAGTDPDNECTLDTLNCVAANCNGTTGAGACEAANGTECIAASCMSGNQTSQGTCNAGSCQGSMTSSCGAYECGLTACETMCTTSAQCATGNFCDTSTNTCQPQVTVGGACMSLASDECTTGHCVDSFCCDSACTDTCGACDLSGNEGMCTAYASGTDPDNECAFDMLNCVQNDCNGTLGPSACDAPNGTECIAASCMSGSQTTQGTCTAGSCGGSSTSSCDPYICGTSACEISCMSSTDCIGGFYCDTTTNTCLMQGMQGDSCTGSEPDECSSNNCIDNFCCDTTCPGLCESCNGANTIGANGTCSFITMGTDPDSECGGMTCDGAGMCN